MTIQTPSRLLASLAALLALGAAIPAAAEGASLPVPFVSRALDALLLPLTPPVREALGLVEAPQGVLVLGLRPEGTGQAAGVAPGDILSLVGEVEVTDPLRIDQVVLYGIGTGVTGFTFGLQRAEGEDRVEVVAAATIPEPRFWEELEVATAPGWAFWTPSLEVDARDVVAAQRDDLIAAYGVAADEIVAGLGSSEFLVEVEGKALADRDATVVAPAARGTDPTADASADPALFGPEDLLNAPSELSRPSDAPEEIVTPPAVDEPAPEAIVPEEPAADSEGDASGE